MLLALLFSLDNRLKGEKKRGRPLGGGREARKNAGRDKDYR